MRIIDYFANHGIRFYLNMPSEDYIKGMAAIPALWDQYPDASIDLNTVTIAARYRYQMELDYKAAQEEFEAAKDTLREYSATLVNNLDEFNNAVQTTGGFLADGVSLAPSYALPQTSVTEAYSTMLDGNNVANFVNQITSTINTAKFNVQNTKAKYEDALDLEKKAVNTSIYKLTILHI